MTLPNRVRWAVTAPVLSGMGMYSYPISEALLGVNSDKRRGLEPAT